MIKIFKGDDTDFKGRVLRLSFGADGLDLTGCKAELSFCGIVKEIECGGGCEFILALSAAETAALPIGVHFATLRLIDGEGRRITVSNTIRVSVTDSVAAVYGDTFGVNTLTVALPKVMAGETFDLGGSNGDVRQFLASLAERFGAKVINSEEAS